MQKSLKSWWRHQVETFSASRAFYAGNSPVPGEFPSQRPVTRSFDVFFDLWLNKHLSKQSWGWWFETPSCSLWRHCNVIRSTIHNFTTSFVTTMTLSHQRVCSLIWINCNPTWMSNNIHYKVCGEITYTFANCGGVTVEVWESISIFFPQFTGHVITNPCWN